MSNWTVNEGRAATQPNPLPQTLYNLGSSYYAD